MTGVSIDVGKSFFERAAKGLVYVEFQVPTRSLLQGGKDVWFNMLGPNASNSLKDNLQSKGGMLPQFKNLSGILQVK